MFPISITTLTTEDTYLRFAWAVFLRRKSFLWRITLIVGALLLSLLIWPAEDRHLSFFAVPFAALVLLTVFYWGINFRFKRAYRKTPYWQDMEQTLVFEEEQFFVKSTRGEFAYQYAEIVKVFDTQSDIFIMLGPNVGFPIEKKDCSPEALDFLLALKGLKPSQ